MPEYLFRRTDGIVGLLRRLIEDGCAQAIATGQERLTRNCFAGTAIRLGNLADLDPSPGEIPGHPRATPARRSRRRRARPRNTVFDDHGDRSARADGHPPAHGRLARSLDPLAGESLGGYLLRLLLAAARQPPPPRHG